jgi:hypothetical protein
MLRLPYWPKLMKFVICIEWSKVDIFVKNLVKNYYLIDSTDFYLCVTEYKAIAKPRHNAYFQPMC